MTLVLLYPFASAFYYSFFDHYLGAGSTCFVGFGNYGDLLRDQRFWID